MTLVFNQVLTKRWRAAYAWSTARGGPGLTTCYFRRHFTMDEVPAQFLAHVSADSRYRLWVNGIPVGRGPLNGVDNGFVGNVLQWNMVAHLPGWQRGEPPALKAGAGHSHALAHPSGHPHRRRALAPIGGAIAASRPRTGVERKRRLIPRRTGAFTRWAFTAQPKLSNFGGCAHPRADAPYT